MSRTVTATVRGTTYEIPEIWLIGFPGTVEEGVQWWAYQSELAALEVTR